MGNKADRVDMEIHILPTPVPVKGGVWCVANANQSEDLGIDRRSYVHTMPEANQPGAYIVILPGCAYSGKICVEAQQGA